MQTTRLYRPGAPFGAAELQVMLREGVLRHVIDDVYVQGDGRVDAATRVEAVGRMLSGRLARGSVICGETAAWVLIGGHAPERLTLIISSGRRRRPAGGLDWQLHQVPVEQAELIDLGQLPVTTPERTAQDLFLGVGTLGSRGALDIALARLHYPGRDRLDWPSRAPADLSRDERLDSFHRADRRAVRRRWETLSRLLLAGEDEISRERLAARITARLGRRREDPERAAAVAELLDQCASRRFPTVR